MEIGFGIVTGLVLLLMLLALAATVAWIVYLIEAVQMPDAQWQAAGQNKLLHIVLMVVLGVIGTIIYFVTARTALKQVGPPPLGYRPPPPPGYGPPT